MTKLWLSLLLATTAAAGVVPRSNWGSNDDNKDASHGNDHWKGKDGKDDNGKHWGWDKDKGGKGHDRDGDNGHDKGHDGKDGDKGHGGKPGGKDLTVEDIMNHPNVPVEVTYPIGPNTGTVKDFIDPGKIPVWNGTRDLLNGQLPANLGDASTSKAGATGQFGPEQGTNSNAAVFRYHGSVVARQYNPDLQLNLSIGAADYEGRKLDLTAQPDLPLPNPDRQLRCEYAYEHVLGGNGTTPKGALWALEGYVDLVAADVRQGGIGDCGMGAAVQALAAGGWTRYLTRMFLKRFDTPNAGDRNIVAVFRRDGKVQPVLIDDQLPTLRNANPNCWQYPGFQPVNDAAYPDVTKPTPIFFMPLFEKVSPASAASGLRGEPFTPTVRATLTPQAFAKFLDANADWKSATGYTGYAGLEGVNPSYVLAAITGGTPSWVWRQRPGFDGPIIAAIARCMQGTAPCVVSTTNAQLEGLGTKDSTGGLWLAPNQQPAYIPGETSGLTATDTNGVTFTVIDFDNLKDGKSSVFSWVSGHAYAFAWTRGTRWPIQDLLSPRIKFLNPWGVNPESWPGSNGKGQWDDPAELTSSFRTFLESVSGVFTVTDMPA